MYLGGQPRPITRDVDPASPFFGMYTRERGTTTIFRMLNKIDERKILEGRPRPGPGQFFVARSRMLMRDLFAVAYHHHHHHFICSRTIQQTSTNDGRNEQDNKA